MPCRGVSSRPRPSPCPMFVCLRRLVVVDVDTGTDDALALLLLLAADAAGEVTLLGVTCVAGNTSLANVCRNTLRLLRAANRLDVSRVDRREPPRIGGRRWTWTRTTRYFLFPQIPVFAGADGPLISDRPDEAFNYHGEDGFGDLDHEVRTLSHEAHAF